MSNAIKQAKSLKYAILGITLVSAAVISQSNSFSFNSASQAGSDVAVKRLDTPSVSKLWSDYEAVFAEQENDINLSFADVDNATLEVDYLVAEIDREMSDFLALEVQSGSSSASIQFGLAAIPQKSL